MLSPAQAADVNAWDMNGQTLFRWIKNEEIRTWWLANGGREVIPVSGRRGWSPTQPPSERYGGAPTEETTPWQRGYGGGRNEQSRPGPAPYTAPGLLK